MRIVGLFLLLALPCFADVLDLADGRRLVGDVAEKNGVYSIRIDGEELTFSKEDVKLWIKSPKEMLGDADKSVEAAKKLYLEALNEKDDKKADAMFHDALPMVRKAREAYAEARECFPQGHAELDDALVNIMKLMRLVRERCGSQIASSGPVIKTSEPPKPEVKPEPPKPEPPKPAGSPEERLAAALAIARQPEKRGDYGQRAAARAALDGVTSPMGRALSVFLLLDDKDWGLVTDTVWIKAASFEQSYSGRLLKRTDTEMRLVTPQGELRLWKGTPWKVALPGGQPFEAVEVKVAEDVKGPAFEPLQAWLSGGATDLKPLVDAVKAIQAKDASARVDALLVFLGGVIDALLGVAVTDDLLKTAAAVGWKKPEWGNLVGTNDGIALECFHRWLSVGLLDMALVEFGKEYGNSSSFSVQYARGILLTLRALQAGRMYDKAYIHFETMAKSATSSVVKEHLLAMAKSIRAAAPCKLCAGTQKVKCATCHGKTKLNLQCNFCGGSGKKQTLKGVVQCPGCKGVGTFQNVDCPKCKATGIVDCKVKGCTVVPAPKQESMFSASVCDLCHGRGTLYERVALTCPECAGIGLFFWPKSDPRKGLKGVP